MRGIEQEQSLHGEGPYGQKTFRTIFLTSSPLSDGLWAIGVSRFAMNNSALHRPIFFVTEWPILVASGCVRGCGRMHRETYAFSSHWLTSWWKASSTRWTGSTGGMREEISRIACSLISSKSYRVAMERSRVQCSCGDRVSL